MPRVEWDKVVVDETTSRKRCREIQDILSEAGSTVDKYGAIVQLLDSHTATDWNLRAEKLRRQLGGAAQASVPDLSRSLPYGLSPPGISVPVKLEAVQVCKQHAAPSTSMSSAAAAPPTVCDVPNLSKSAAVTKKNERQALEMRAFHEAAFRERQAREKELLEHDKFPYRAPAW